MKTTANTTTATVKLPKLALYLAIVAVMAFFNCLILKAGEPEKDNNAANTAEYIKTLTEELAEETLEIEDWMLSFNETYFAETVEEELRLEAWMFNFDLLEGPEYYADAQEEDLEIEDWMLAVSNDYYALDEAEQQQFYGITDADVCLEPWMTSEQESFVAFVEVKEEEVRLEAWMLNYDHIDGPVYYADAAEEDLEIENWMLSICCWDLTGLLAENK